MMSKLSRTKGHSFERHTASEFKRIFPQARRQLEYHEDDAKGIDLQNTGRYRVQCKRGRGYAPINKIFEVQCLDFLGVDEVPVLVTRADNCPTMAVIPFDKLLELIEVHEKEKTKQNEKN